MVASAEVPMCLELFVVGPRLLGLSEASGMPSNVAKGGLSTLPRVSCPYYLERGLIIEWQSIAL
jgi:hypothetical protein